MGIELADHIRMKRIYDPPALEDGRRILVDRLWPRGVSKDKAKIDIWCREAAPSPELRVWFGHQPERFPTFRERYRQELSQDPIRHSHALDIREMAIGSMVTLVYAAKDPIHNHVVVLKDYILQL